MRIPIETAELAIFCSICRCGALNNHGFPPFGWMDSPCNASKCFLVMNRLVSAAVPELADRGLVRCSLDTQIDVDELPIASESYSACVIRGKPLQSRRRCTRLVLRVHRLDQLAQR